MRYLILIVSIIACSSVTDKNTRNQLIGKYELETSNSTHIAELLELNQDSIFVFSGLKEEDSYKFTWVIEGKWKLVNDSILLNTEDFNTQTYGRNINLKYLRQFNDSIDFLDQNVIICRDLLLNSKKGKISRLEKKDKLTYRKKHSP